MAKVYDLPYGPAVLLDVAGELSWADIERVAGDRLADGVTVCVRPPGPNTRRGGHFFHIRRTADGFVFRTFDRVDVLTLRTSDECAAFLNHVTGRRYSPEMWAVAQAANLRADDPGPLGS
jgi:hypothetical protein